MLELNKIHCMDCLEGMKQLDDNSVDAIVTDPPYGLSFMNKKWDYDVPSIDIWKEALRVLKHGGYLLSFAGSRTYHRMACNIENAGFEIRDQIMWVYGSGFPKSFNIGKECNITKGNSDWEGWGTALKPAHEPIVMARKPLSEKTVADNVLKWGTGGINIDGCRIKCEERALRENNTSWGINRIGEDNSIRGNKAIGKTTLGRFPANFIHDGSEEVLDLFPNNIEGKDNYKHSSNSIFGNKTKDNYYNGESKSTYGSAARFFYCAKASKSERNKGLEKNIHPTVKPVKLMKYLVNLVSHDKSTILDPFMGSGTTAVACKQLNRNYIGFELNQEYVNIAEKRINNVPDPLKKYF